MENAVKMFRDALIATASVMGAIVVMAGVVQLHKIPQVHRQSTVQTVPCDTTYISIVDTVEVIDTTYLIRATRYNPVVGQCDSDPLTTADNSKIDINKLNSGELRWCALSRDLIARWGGPFNYGDTLEIYSKDRPQMNGFWVLHDTMNKRYSETIDFLQPKNAEGPKLGIGKDFVIITRTNELEVLDVARTNC